MARYIDADNVMEEIARIGGHNLCEWETIGVKALIDRQPTADVVEVKHARWENVGDSEEDLCFRCTNCKEEFSCEVDFRSYVKYCPECGAKMDGERREVCEKD